MPYVCFGNILTANAVFTVISFFALTRANMTMFFPNAISGIAELKVTFRRIEAFLRLEDTPTPPTSTLLTTAVSTPTSSLPTVIPAPQDGTVVGVDTPVYVACVDPHYVLPIMEPSLQNIVIHFSHLSCKWLAASPRETIDNIHLQVH